MTDASPLDAGSPRVGGRLLVVEDDARLARLITEVLQRAGYDVVHATDGEQGFKHAMTGAYDVVILDILLPRLSGYKVLEHLRAAGRDVPVVMLTSKDGEYDEADAFDLGADDYIVKPFRSVTLLARVANAMRRRAAEPASDLVVGPLRVARSRRRAWLHDQELDLTAREFDLLAYLTIRHGEAVSKHELLEHVWREPFGSENAVEVCIASLRKNLGVDCITTLRGVGYRLDVAP